ncbi:phosphate acyltransferase PlsX [Candidatus Riflebacteria bacterium]
MKIAVDAMGGDYAPKEIVFGTFDYARKFSGDTVFLVGKEERIEQEIEKYCKKNGCVCPKNLIIVPAEEDIGMDEHPAAAVKKRKDCSLRVANRLVKNRKAQAILSMGNTGGCVASSLFELGRLPGVVRPSVATIFPTNKGGVVLLDMGANIDCTPQQLLQFAQLGSIYAESVLNRKNPKVALLNIGAEEIKGSKTLVQTYELLKIQDDINFVGNIEGDHIFFTKVDVIICDGLVGNIILKTCEGLSHAMLGMLKKCLDKNRIEESQQLKIFKDMESYSARNPRYACAPLLGFGGLSIIGHGNSRAKKVFDSISVIREICNSRLEEKMKNFQNIAPKSGKLKVKSMETG